MLENKPRVRVFTKSYELICIENHIHLPIAKFDLLKKWILSPKSTTTQNENQLNFFYNLRP